MQPSPRELVNRGNNLAGVAFLTILGIGIAPEILLEDEWLHRVDDSLLLVIGVGTLIWYLSGRNRFKRSALPLLLIMACLVIKGIAAFGLEATDQKDAGDDIGVMFVLITATVFNSVLLLRTRAAGGTERVEVTAGEPAETPV